MICDEGAQKMWMLFQTGTWIIPLATQCPYADQLQIVQYADLIWQLAFVVNGTIATVGIELSQVIRKNAVEMSADVAAMNVHELNEQLIKHGKLKQHSRARFQI